MKYGQIKALAQCWINEWPAHRVLVSVENNDWLYLYIGANNYIMRAGDICCWDDDKFHWYRNEGDCVQFNLLQPAMKIA